jgi:hypothetical protein
MSSINETFGKTESSLVNITQVSASFILEDLKAHM